MPEPAVSEALAPTTNALPATRPAGAAGAQPLGLVPRNIEEAWRLAQMFAKSSIVPKNFINHPEDVLVAMQLGFEIGFAPMTALQSIAVINGRPSVWGDGFLALIMSSPLYQDHDEYYEVDGQRRDGLVAEDLKKDTTCAVCTFERRGKAKPVTRRFTIAQAKKAGLWAKDGPWQTYPDRQLAMRARGFAGRDAFPDLLRGIKTAEEARDIPLDDPAPTIIEAPRVQRLSEAPTPAATAPPTPAAAPFVHEEVTLTGAVATVDPLLGGHCVTLATGQQVIADKPADITELSKFVGTAHALRFTCVRGDDDRLYVKTFVIAD